MSIDGAISVLSAGMVTAVGSNCESTCAAMRAGISGIRDGNLWDFTVGERLTVGRPYLNRWWEGPTMLAELLAPAITECLDRVVGLPELRASVNLETLPLLVILSPGDRPHRTPNLNRVVLDNLARKLDYPLPANSAVIPGGRTGIAAALEQAASLMATSGMCIIAGAESFLRQELAEYYTNVGRLLCGANSNGFNLGEAACAVLVGPARRTSGSELIIQGMGVGHEAAGTGSDAETTLKGDGLTAAMRLALSAAGCQSSEIQFTISDLNGEQFKFKEVVISQARLDRLPPPGAPARRLGYLDMWHAAEFIGEVGAAIFPCILGWALEAGRRGYARGERCLLHAGEDSGLRVAVVTQFNGGTA